MAKGTVGKVVQVLGAVVDCEFPQDSMPSIFNAIEIQQADVRVANSLLASNAAGVRSSFFMAPAQRE